jgi:hypothetical protein
MRISDKWKEARESLRKYFAITVIEIAKRNNLTVEYIGLPPQVDGFLDPHDEPRFIAVNQEFHPTDQNFAICREIGRYHQAYRLNSSNINSPQKWKLLDEAPSQIRTRICELDLESRAHMMLAFFGRRNEFFEFAKRHPKRHFGFMLITGKIDYLFLKLRIRKFFYKISWPIRAIINSGPMASSF